MTTVTDAKACAIAWQAFRDRSPLMDSPEAAFRAGWQLSNVHHARKEPTRLTTAITGPATSDDIARLRARE